MFNIGVFGINASEGFSGRDYVDPLGGEKLQGGLIRARRIEVEILTLPSQVALTQPR
jgi:hypothetical protein